MIRISDERILALLIGLPAVYLYFSGLGQFYRVFAFLNYAVYMVVFLLSMLAYSRTILLKSNFIIFYLFVIVLLFNSMMYPESVEYLINYSSVVNIILSNVFTLLVIALPVFLLSKQENDFELLISELNNIGTVISSLFVITFALIVFVFKIDFDYMNITYGCIPWLFFAFGHSIYYKTRYNRIISIIAFTFIALSGCRGALLTTAIYLALTYLISLKNGLDIRKVMGAILLFILGLVIILNFDYLVSFLYETLSGMGFKSRTLELYLDLSVEDGLFHYSDRERIQLPLINNLNIIGHGLYGDRVALNGVYAHNVFLELLYDFGIIIGGIICIIYCLLLICSIRLMFDTRNNHIQLIIATSLAVLTCKYMVSSSLFSTAEFWFLIGLLLGCMRMKKLYYKNT